MWRYLERRGVRKLEGQSPKNLLNIKLIKEAYKDWGSQWGHNHAILKGQAGRFAQWGLQCPYNTSRITRLILSRLILDKQSTRYVTDARTVLSCDGITVTNITEMGQMSNYITKNGNLSFCFWVKHKTDIIYYLCYFQSSEHCCKLIIAKEKRFLQSVCRAGVSFSDTTHHRIIF